MDNPMDFVIAIAMHPYTYLPDFFVYTNLIPD
jgi:hypothetical protein